MFRFGAFCGGHGWSWLFPRPQKSAANVGRFVFLELLSSKSSQKKQLKSKQKRVVLLDILFGLPAFSSPAGASSGDKPWMKEPQS